MSAAVYDKSDIARMKQHGRSFGAAKVDRLTADFLGSTLSANQEIAASIVSMRGRARTLCMDVDYAKRFLAMCRANIVGATGIGLQSAAKLSNGKPDKKTRKLFEQHWKRFCTREFCTMSGGQTFREVCEQVTETVARDGECLVRLVRDSSLEYGFALHVLESDYLDHKLNVSSDNLRITMGVEHDKFYRPTAYHLHTRHPSEYLTASVSDRKHERVLAKNLVHIYKRDRPLQMRGVTWFSSSMLRLNMLAKYEEAEQVAAREAASKMGFFRSQDGTGGPPVTEDDDGVLTTESSPGTFDKLPAGLDFVPYDPQHPTSAFKDFVKSMLRGAASGLGVSYNTLANDLEGVNFSSIRSGVQDDRDRWRSEQQFLIDALCDPVRMAFTKAATLPGKPLGTYPVNQLERLFDVKWQPRGWQWVDPLRDQQSNREAHAMKVTTLQEIASSRGQDIEEIFEQLEREAELLKQYNLEVQAPEPAKAGDQGEDEDEKDDEENG